MIVIRIVRESFSLLSRRQKWLFVAFTGVLMLNGLLDVAGVLLLGFVSVLSITAISGDELPSALEQVVERLGLGGEDPVRAAGLLALAAAVLLVSKTLIGALMSRKTLKFLSHRQAALSGELVARLLSRPLLEVHARATQDVGFVIMQGTQAAMIGVLGPAASAVADVALIGVLGLALTAVDPSVTVFAVLFLGLLALVLQRSLSVWASRLGLESTFVDVDSYRAIGEAMTSYREVLVLDRRGLYVDRIQRLRWASADISADTAFMSSIPKYVFDIGLVVGALILAATQYLTKDITEAVGIVAVFLVAGSRITPAVMRLQGAALAIRRAEAPASRALDLVRELNSMPSSRQSLIETSEIRRRLEAGYSDFNPSIIVDDVWLTYQGTHTAAVAGVSFAVPEGSSIAFAGTTGAGKSTLADILLGVVEPERGLVTIGGLAPADAISKWPGSIAYVPQEVFLANGTVRDNVALGLPRGAINDDWVWVALERAHLAVFLRDNREGLETLIGENGMRLSGGQRQRLGIARGLFSRPKLLVLDEATSALDVETEQAISQTMQELEGHVTTVTIAHRLSTILHCDKVMYLEDGRVTAEGTFEQVRAQSAAFDRQAKLLGLG
jgi:ABC-type multidrug transport system fused ATPase/permease subunit